ELTAVVVMPAFLEKVRFDVASNWFPLHDPDQMKIDTARMIAQGRKLMEIRESLATAEECGHYRAGDLERLSNRLGQLEAKLPLQTLTVDVPYETTASGFQLFTPGSTALAPELLGYQGINRIPVTLPSGMTNVSLFLLGKHISIH